MKNIYKLIVVLLAIVGLNFSAKAQQDPIFSQYIINPMMYNPAYVANYEMSSATAMTRVQWLGPPAFSVTSALSGSASFKKMGFGFNVISDRVGLDDGYRAFRSNEVNLMYAYKVELSEGTYLNAGFQTGFSNKKINNEELNMKDQDDPSFQGTPGATRLNFGTGLYLINEEKYFLGVSIPRVLNSTFKDGGVIAQSYKRHYYFSGGVIIGSTGSLPIRPSFLIRTAEGVPASVDLSTSVLLSQLIWAGVTVRNFEGLAILAQLDVNEKIRIGYSMDIPLSGAIFKNLATHELVLNINFAAFKDQVVVYPRYF